MNIDPRLLEANPGTLFNVFYEVQEVLKGLPPLSKTLHLPYKERIGALYERYSALGVTTLHPDSFELLYSLYQKWEMDMVAHLSPKHEATYKAEDKQAILPEGVMVQKTITVMLNWKLFLITGAGPFIFGPKEQKALVRMLQLTRQLARHKPYRFHFNPRILVPEVDLLQLRGIVNPFFMPALEPGLHAIVVVPWPKEYAGYVLAIALSPVESLLLPLSLFNEFLKGFIQERTDLIFL
jgi:hypothetical protein